MDVRRDIICDNRMTGRVQRCILIAGLSRDAPVARVWVSAPYYPGNVDALCMADPLYDLILGNILCVK